MINMSKPEVSKVQMGLKGKSILIYGNGGTGKTINTVTAPRTMLIAFENGINALSGVTYVQPESWGDWTAAVRYFTSPATREEAKKLYDTIVVDSLDPLFSMAEKFICDFYGVPGVDRDQEGKKGYGYWREYRRLISDQFNALLSSGFTVIFIGHETERDLRDVYGNEYKAIYPSGDKGSVSWLCTNCDFVLYAKNNPPDEDGNEVYSNLYSKETAAFFARSRFKKMDPVIPQWNLEKLTNAINKAIDNAAAAGSNGGETYEEKTEREAKKKEEEAKARIALPDLIKAIGEKVKKMLTSGIDKSVYEDILQECLGDKTFQCKNATEKQREQLEMVLAALTDKGF